MDDLMIEFLTETFEALDAIDVTLAHLTDSPHDPHGLEQLLRHLHTLKGSAAFLGLPQVTASAHEAENLLARRRGEGLTAGDLLALRPLLERISGLLAHVPAVGDGALAGEGEPVEAAGAPRTLRVPIDLWGQIETQIAAFERARDQLRQLLPLPADGAPGQVLHRLAAIADGLSLSLAEARLQPAAEAFRLLPRLVRHLATETGKRATLSIDHGDLALDRDVLDRLRAPLSHMLRNAVDHGIEAPTARASAGKSAIGSLNLSLRCDGRTITLTLSDDGAGLDPFRLRTKALEMGLASQAELEAMSPDALARFIFHPGFSTAAAVTTRSGRGVGMDVVRSEIEALGGTVSAAARPGRGAVFRIVLPVTVAAIPALVLTLGARRFAIARSAVAAQTAFGPDAAHRVDHVGGAALMRWRDRLLAALDLPLALGKPAPAVRTRGHAVIVESAGAVFAGLTEEAPNPERLILTAAGARDAAGGPVHLIDLSRLAEMAGLAASEDRRAEPSYFPAAARA